MEKEVEIRVLLRRYWANYRNEVIEPHSSFTTRRQIIERAVKVAKDYEEHARLLGVPEDMLLIHAEVARALSIEKFGKPLSGREIRKRVMARCPGIYSLDELGDRVGA